MNDRTSTPDRPTDGSPARPRKQEQEPASEEVIEVAPGVLRTQLPIEMPGLGHVNCYVLEDERGIALVDPGLPGDKTWGDLTDRLRRAGYRVSDVHTVVVTHSHPDHFGGALRLRHETGADVVTHATFRTLMSDLTFTDTEDSGDLAVNSLDDQLAAIERFFFRPSPWGGNREGPGPEFREWMRADYESVGEFSFRIRPTRPLTDGQTIRLARREWVALHTPGHTHDHLCLYDPEHGVMFTGDHVLPSITPHIGVLHEHADPLALFFESLNRIGAMTDVRIALPAHGQPFTDLRGRTDDIIEHHAERLDVIRQATANLPEGTVDEFMRVLFRERSWGDMAASETYAHLEHLRLLGEFVRVDDRGLARYRPAG